MPKPAEVQINAEVVVENEKPAEIRIAEEIEQTVEAQIILKAPVETEKPVEVPQIQPQIEEELTIETEVEETVSFTIRSSKPAPEQIVVSVIPHFHQRFIILIFRQKILEEIFFLATKFPFCCDNPQNPFVNYRAVIPKCLTKLQWKHRPFKKSPFMKSLSMLSLT